MMSLNNRVVNGRSWDPHGALKQFGDGLPEPSSPESRTPEPFGGLGWSPQDRIGPRAALNRHDLAVLSSTCQPHR